MDFIGSGFCVVCMFLIPELVTLIFYKYLDNFYVPTCMYKDTYTDLY